MVVHVSNILKFSMAVLMNFNTTFNHLNRDFYKSISIKFSHSKLNLNNFFRKKGFTFNL